MTCSSAIQIGDHLVGPGQKCLIVCEAGVNHNGRIDLAERLIDAAKRAGADAVKFQAWNTARLVRPDSPEYRTFLPLELSEGQLRHLKAYADERGIMFLCTPDDEIDADFLDELVPAFKIHSYNLRNLPFLRHVAAKGKPIILSTGMGDMEAVRQAVDAIGATPLVLLHCLSVYPTEQDVRSDCSWWHPEDVNLRAMDALREFGYPVGFSDHSPVNCIALAAVALGACMIERHLRLEETRGPDRHISIDEYPFRNMVFDIRQVEAAMGDGVKRSAAAELETLKGIEGWRK